MPAAYALACWWYAWRRPARRTVLVAVWYDGLLLLVSHSYKDTDTMPGGGVRRNEPPACAAARELREETGISVAADRLVCVGEVNFTGRYGPRTTWLYELKLRSAPRLRANGWETVGARLARPDEVRRMALSDPFASYLKRSLAALSLTGAATSFSQAVVPATPR